MASQLLSTFKYGVLAAVAFIGPQIITDSGDWLGNVHQPPQEEKASPVHLETRTYRSASLPGRSPIAQRLAEGTIGPLADSPVSPIRESINVPLSNTSLPNAGNPYTAHYPATRCPVVPLEEAVRFDHSPNWILTTWPRVDTVRGGTPLFGYRVALLTGTQNDDLTGVLTYYYDNTQLQEIVFSGQTGDYHRLLHFLESRYGMIAAKETSLERMMFISTLTDQRPGFHENSQLTIRPTQTFFADRKENFYDVSFTLYRP